MSSKSLVYVCNEERRTTGRPLHAYSGRVSVCLSAGSSRAANASARQGRSRARRLALGSPFFPPFLPSFLFDSRLPSIYMDVQVPTRGGALLLFSSRACPRSILESSIPSIHVTPAGVFSRCCSECRPSRPSRRVVVLDLISLYVSFGAPSSVLRPGRASKLLSTTSCFNLASTPLSHVPDNARPGSINLNRGVSSR